MLGRWCLLPTLLVACTTGNPVFLPPDESTGDVTGETTDAPEASTTGFAESTAGTTADEPDPPPGDSTGGTGTPMTSGGGGSGLTAPGESGDGTTGADASTTTGADGCADECGTPGCGECPEVDMIGLPGFAIAAREASNLQYEQFLAADVDPATQPAACAWNTDFTPIEWPLPVAAGELPVVNIDWCDAQAFCQWTGRRLCGRIGGGASTFGAVVSPALDQWYRACSGGLGMQYPYGTLYDASACNGKDAGIGGPLASGSLAACQGPVPGLFDLSGNVWEWVDTCNGDQGPDDDCLRRGGSFNSIPNDLRCDLLSKRPRNMALDHVGVRCCED